MNDYLLDPVTNDLQIVNGDFVLGDATQQNQKQLIYASPGAYKQYPTVGVDIMNYLKDENSSDLLRAIRQQFILDGMTVNSLAYTNGQINVNAEY
jgi:hypothetical protein